MQLGNTCSDRAWYTYALGQFEEKKRKSKIPLYIYNNSVLYHRKVIALELDKLRKLVDERDPKAHQAQAIAAYTIAERGGVEDLPRLERLAKHAQQELEKREKAGGSKVHLSFLTKATDSALIVMRCRLWKELEKQ